MGTGIILVNTGTPDAPAPDAVERYLRQFLMHDRIRPLPSLMWRVILEQFILPNRKNDSAQKYSQIWTEDGSPLAATQARLADKLQRSLQEAGQDVRVISAMSFGSPSLEDAVSELERCGCDNLVVLPLYPQYAYSNAGIPELDLKSVAEAHSLAKGARLVRDYWRHDAYLDAIANSVSDAGFDAGNDDFLIVSYHSVPRDDVAEGDTYQATTEASTKAIAERLGLRSDQYALCYQSRFDKGRRWLDPFLGPTLDAAASNGAHSRVFVVTPGFAIDCLETLYDIEVVMRERFKATRETAGLSSSDDSFVYVSCLNDSDAQVAVCEAAIKS